MASCSHPESIRIRSGRVGGNLQWPTSASHIREYVADYIHACRQKWTGTKGNAASARTRWSRHVRSVKFVGTTREFWMFAGLFAFLHKSISIFSFLLFSISFWTMNWSLKCRQPRTSIGHDTQFDRIVAWRSKQRSHLDRTVRFQTIRHATNPIWCSPVKTRLLCILAVNIWKERPRSPGHVTHKLNKMNEIYPKWAHDLTSIVFQCISVCRRPNRDEPTRMFCAAFWAYRH